MLQDAAAKFHISGNPFLIYGHIHGISSPSLQVLVEETDEGSWSVSSEIAVIEAALADALPDLAAAGEADRAPSNLFELVHYLSGAMFRIHQALRFPVTEAGRVFALRDVGQRRQVVAYIPLVLPCAAAAARLFGWLVDMVNGRNDDIASVNAAASTLVADISGAFPGDSATGYFLGAAIELGMPVDWVTADIFQFGYARHARSMTGTFTDATSRFGAVIARDKMLAAEILRQHGLPVPGHVAVGSIEEGVEAAAGLGYPVVVKPVDLDGGVGVSAGLTQPQQVRAAMATALAHSPRVLVEKHVSGRDYRMIVLHGKLIAVTERTPGGVVGDGFRTIRVLLEQYNSHPMRGEQRYHPLKPLVVDEEAVFLLSAEGLNLDSIPGEGCFVRMRSAANVVRGGSTRDVTALVHPDNRAVAERAARALNIDLAGVDFLTDDIEHSWLASGGAICEVNAQPSLGYVTTAHLYPQILKALVGSNGRVPIVLIYGAEQPDALMRALIQQLAPYKLPIGGATCNGVWIDGERISAKPASVFEAGRILLRDRRVAAVILAMNDFSVLETGLPCDAFDLLVIAGDALTSGPAWEAVEPRAILEAIVPACRGEVLLSSTSAMPLATLQGLVPSGRLEVVADGELLGAILPRFGCR